MKFLIVLGFILNSIISTASAEESSWEHFKSNWAIAATSEEAQVRNTLYIGTAITATLVLFREDVVEPFQEHMSENEPMGHDLALFGDYMGQLVPNILYLGGMYADYKLSNDAQSLRLANLMLKTSFYSALTTTVLKYTVRERRPNKGDRKSFPSGHTTTAFAFASVVAMEHEWYWGTLAYTMAAIVGLSRVNDNAHYLHDVTMGATIGMAYGFAFSLADKKKNSQANYHPVFLKDGVGFGMTYTY